MLPSEEDSSLFKKAVCSHVLSMVLNGLACSCCKISKSDLVNEKEEALEVAVQKLLSKAQNTLKTR